MSDTILSEPVLRLGTRRSPLAMAQAHEARARLCAAHGWDENRVELVSVLASGDKVQDRALAEIGGKALWTKELDEWLAEGRIDGAVHSMKDVETIRPEHFMVAAVLPRADIADVLIGADSIDAIPEGSMIGTSAPRRAAQLLNSRPDCTVVPIRGNVATRLAKLKAGQVDATFLAAAGLSRLGEDTVGSRLDPEGWLPAPSQGAIGIECRADDQRMQDLLSAIDHPQSHEDVRIERRLLSKLSGDCHSPIAMLTSRSGDLLALRCALFSPDGTERIEDVASGDAGDLRWVDGLAADLLAKLSAEMRPHFGLNHESCE